MKNNNNNEKINDDISIEMTAKTMFGEARGEFQRYGISSLVAIANVIRNRYMSHNNANKSIPDICLAPYQFSCWNKDDPNYECIKDLEKNNDRIYQYCLFLAKQVLEGDICDITGGATHYYSRRMKDPPYWAKNQTPTETIGNHIFFKLDN